ncbi:MAG: hypothetical protein AMS27_09275 [Bacteroides sp. SM23_62_1]|nr:MAG: hypothetical protein AMS27_09275 [Bacteroides sp. SM23_62_1]
MRNLIGLILPFLFFLFHTALTGCDKVEEDDILKDVDGNAYKIVRIGTQTWMAENLKVTHNKNGEAVTSYCYNDSQDDCALFGRLYTWKISLEVCPDGWHVPSDEEWRQLETELGLSYEESILTGWRGTDHGTSLKEGGSSGFNAMLAGYKDGTVFWDGRYFDKGYFGAYWSRSQLDSFRAMAFFVHVNSDRVLRSDYDKTAAFSVRCVKNE